MDVVSLDVISYLEVIGIEAVESAFGRFCLRVHEEADRRTPRPRLSDIVREVVRRAVHLPGAE